VLEVDSRSEGEFSPGDIVFRPDGRFDCPGPPLMRLPGLLSLR
jgi:hypothetical protein